jgi:imidazole glycerol-phosphate synthase subunit HisF
MLKTRIIPVLFIKNGLIVRSENFDYHQNIGNVINQAQRFNEWNVDELIYIDISRENEYDLRRDDHKVDSCSSIEEIIAYLSKICFMPLTFGGGIRTIEKVDFFIRNGADKITVNSQAIESPSFVQEIAKKYGSQAVVVSIDYKVIDNNPIVFSNFGKENTGVNLFDWIKEMEYCGAGEVMINSIDRDGASCGFDLDNIGRAVDNSKIPIVACGGAGSDFDFLELAKLTKVSAIAAGNWFHFVERSYPRVKQLFKKNNIYVR